MHTKQLHMHIRNAGSLFASVPRVSSPKLPPKKHGNPTKPQRLKSRSGLQSQPPVTGTGPRTGSVGVQHDIDDGRHHRSNRSHGEYSNLTPIRYIYPNFSRLYVLQLRVLILFL